MSVITIGAGCPYFSVGGCAGSGGTAVGTVVAFACGVPASCVAAGGLTATVVLVPPPTAKVRPPAITARPAVMASQTQMRSYQRLRVIGYWGVCGGGGACIVDVIS